MRKFMFVLLALVAMVLAATFIVPSVPAVATPVGCVGAPGNEPAGGVYPESRQFVESQAWWVPEPGQTGTNQGHVHLGACIPERETLNAAVTPNFTANVRVVTHENPGTVTYVSLVFKTTSSETTVQKAQINGLSCPVGTCERWVSFSWPLSAFDRTGLQEIRFRVFVNEPDGKKQHSSINFQTTIVGTGKPLSNVTRMPYLRGKGWYTNALYCEASYLSVPLPDAPVSGIWSPRVQQVTHSSDASLPVTSYLDALDPDFHAEPPSPGTVVAQGAGQLPPTNLSIDTTTLVNGTHKLHMRANCRDNSQSSTNSGVLVVPFLVGN